MIYYEAMYSKYGVAKRELLTIREMEVRNISAIGMRRLKTSKNNTYKIFNERYIWDESEVKYYDS